MSADLIELYRQMAELTAPECRSTCRTPFSCCSPEYCLAAQDWAKLRWGTELTPVNGRSTRGEPLPFLGPNGCVVPPHMRPMCTLHTCEVNSVGCKKGDPQWTARYFELRERIDSLEALL